MLIAIGCVLLYCAASYYFNYKELSRNAGPAGLGWFTFPFSPIIGPMLVWYGIKEVFTRIFR